MLRVLVVLASFVIGTAIAHAETIALLPLDGDKRLEIYGQPVAAEIGRALKASGLDIVVVGAKMNVPDRAQLIVDGSIKAGKGDAITLSMRIRDPRDGTVLETLPATAATLTTIDRAAADLSARIVPAVRTHLAALTKPVEPVEPSEKPFPGPPPTVKLTQAPSMSPIFVTAVWSRNPGQPALELLAHATGKELWAWARTHRHEAKAATAVQMNRANATTTLAAEPRADAGIALEILSFSVVPGAVPLGHARVKLLIADGTTIKFERVLKTDTIVGDRGITEDEMAARTAREILAIANAQLRRHVAGWR